MKRAITLIGAFVVILTACASGNAVGVAHTTSGDPNRDCLRDQLDCVQNDDCCSFWCVNGMCDHREP